MATIEEQITELEDEIRKTSYNKATEFHIGKLKAKIARLKDEAEKRRVASKGGGEGYGVKKSGNATVCLVGLPSVGKSTLLNKVTDADSEVGAYHFTTLDVIPGLMEYRGAKIQILDMPGIIAGAAKGKGRGREVLSVVRSCDLILLTLDVFHPQVHILVRELEETGMRLNQNPPNIVVRRSDRGGVRVRTTVPLTKMTEESVIDVMRAYGYVNASVIIREDCTHDQLLDHLSGNKIYVPALVIMNKIDLVDAAHLEKVLRKLKDWKVIEISAENDVGIEEFKESMFSTLEFIRIYMRPQGGETDYKEPMVVKKGTNVSMICDTIHRTFRKKFRYANVWGKSAKYPGQTVGLSHKLADEDVLTVVVRR